MIQLLKLANPLRIIRAVIFRYRTRNDVCIIATET